MNSPPETHSESPVKMMRPADDTTVHRALAPEVTRGGRDYVIALLAAVVAILIRALLEPWLSGDHVFVLSLLAVIFVAWNCGLKPALLALIISMLGFASLFAEYGTFRSFGDVIAISLFVICGVICCYLGDAQLRNQRKLKQALAESVLRRNELQREVDRRTTIEVSLLNREGQLIEANKRYAMAQVQTAEALALLDTFFRNAPIGLAFFDLEARVVRLNEYLAGPDLSGVEQAVGRPLTDVLPQFQSRAVEAYRTVARTGDPVTGLLIDDVALPEGTPSTWSLGLYPVRREGGDILGIGAVCEDVTERKRAEVALAERAELSLLRAEVATILNGTASGTEVLQRCAERIAEHLDAALAGIWELDRETQSLELRAIVRKDADLNQTHYHVPIGQYKIGLIAQTGRPHLTNDLSQDPHLSNRDWATRERISAFAGYPLTVEGKVLGVLALFSRHSLSEAVLSDLAPLADAVAQWLGRQQVIASLKSAEQRFRTLADSIPQLAWMTRADGYIVWYNRRWYEYTGTTPQQMEGWGWESVHDALELPRVLEKFKQAIAAGVNWEDTFPLRRFDGQMRWHLSRARPIRDDEGRIVQWFGTNTDITDQREAEEALRISEHRFRTLTEAIPQMVWNADSTGRFTYVNASWLEYTGLTVEAAQGDGWYSIIHPEDRDLVAQKWGRDLANNAHSFQLEFRLRRATNGEYRWFLAGAVPLRQSDGTIDQWIVSLTDIDDQKQQRETLERLVGERTAELTSTTVALRGEIDERIRAEELLKSASRELARSNEELEKFAYIASHDLQEPLRKIQAFGDRLKVKFKDALTETGQDYLDRILSSATRMRRLINDLLSFSRVTTKGSPFMPVDLNAILREVLSDLEHLISTTGAAVNVGTLPTIDADPSQMRQLFQNLIGNALKFHKHGEAPTVTISAEPDTQNAIDGTPRPWFRIAVADQGIGFDEKYVERIFEVFQRLHGRDEYEGTGVGLAICRKIAQRHSGSIAARSAKGVGSTFEIHLPVNQPQAEFIPYAEPE